MADNVRIAPNYTAVCATDELADGSHAQVVKIANATDGDGTLLSPLTDTELRASAVDVSGPLTDTELRASAVTVSATNLDVRDLTNASDSVAIYGYNGTSNVQPRIDKATNVLDVIDYAHHEVHAGSAFTCHYNNDVTNVNEQTGIAFTTSDTTKYIHLIITAASTGGAYIALYEASDLDAGEGSALTIYNRNRNSLTASTVSSIDVAPVAGQATSWNETQLGGATLSTATELMRRYIGGLGRASIGGETTHGDEWVLKRNTQYCVVMNSLTADDATHNITLDWYEHTDIA